MTTNSIQMFFEKAGFNLEEDNNAAELCDAIVKHINQMINTQPTFLDGKRYTSFTDRLDQLKDRIVKVYTNDELRVMAGFTCNCVENRFDPANDCPVHGKE